MAPTPIAKNMWVKRTDDSACGVYFLIPRLAKGTIQIRRHRVIEVDLENASSEFSDLHDPQSATGRDGRV